MRFLRAVMVIVVACPLAAQTISIYPPARPRRDVVRMLTEKQEQLNQLLSADDSSAAEVGQISMELHRLRQEMTPPDEPYHSQALAILTTDQKTRLSSLETAMHLCSVASQAQMLSLIEPPHQKTNGPVPMKTGRHEGMRQ